MAGKIGLLIAGLVVGLCVAPALPANAQRTTAGRALAARVTLLEARLAVLENQTAPVAKVERRLGDLESATRLLDLDGTYVGYVEATQIWSHYCTPGKAVVWVDHDGYPEPGCDSGPTPAGVTDAGAVPSGGSRPLP